MGHGFSMTAESRLITLNTLALRYQDEAYTLSCYLLGDEARAEKATQAAFDSLYGRDGSRRGFALMRLNPGDIRLEILRRVVSACQREQAHPLPQTGIKDSPESFFGRLTYLNSGERSAAVLVDVLGLDYEEAAQVLGSTRKQVGKLLAQARLSLSAEMENAAVAAF